MNILGIESGKGVADIGAGSGWFTVRAANRVGAGGQVYAIDINPEAVGHIEERARKEHLPNVKTILSKPGDPLLPPNSVDAVLLLKTYHEVAHPVELLRNLRPALRAGAKVGVIDRNGNGENHGVGSDIVIREAKEAEYALVKKYDFVKADGMDYFLVLTPSK
jgi:ubiquinone/menaquinone biosynthesis C-methylase UbiE